MGMAWLALRSLQSLSTISNPVQSLNVASTRPSFSVQNDLTAYDDEELIEKFLTEELGINDELVS